VEEELRKDIEDSRFENLWWWQCPFTSRLIILLPTYRSTEYGKIDMMMYFKWLRNLLVYNYTKAIIFSRNCTKIFRWILKTIITNL